MLHKPKKTILFVWVLLFLYSSSIWGQVENLMSKNDSSVVSLVRQLSDAKQHPAAMKALRKMLPQANVALIHELVQSQDYGIQAFLCQLLAETHDPAAFQAILQAARIHNQQTHVYGNRPLVALGTLGDLRAIPYLSDVLDDEKITLLKRMDAAKALALLGDTRGYPFVEYVLTDGRGIEYPEGSSEGWTFKAYKTLGYIGRIEDKAIDLLIWNLDTGFATPAIKVLEALVISGNRRAIPTLLHIIKYPPADPLLVIEVLETLGKIGGPSERLYLQRTVLYPKWWPGLSDDYRREMQLKAQEILKKWQSKSIFPRD